MDGHSKIEPNKLFTVGLKFNAHKVYDRNVIEVIGY